MFSTYVTKHIGAINYTFEIFPTNVSDRILQIIQKQEAQISSDHHYKISPDELHFIKNARKLTGSQNGKYLFTVFYARWKYLEIKIVHRTRNSPFEYDC